MTGIEHAIEQASRVIGDLPGFTDEQVRGIAEDLAAAGLLAPVPLTEVTVEQVEAAARFAYKTDWAAQRTARMPFSDKYTGDRYRGRVRAMFRAAGLQVQEPVDRAVGDGKAGR
ncbi:MAG: hypothetical protein ACI39C_07350 [Dietzia sp.]